MDFQVLVLLLVFIYCLLLSFFSGLLFRLALGWQHFFCSKDALSCKSGMFPSHNFSLLLGFVVSFKLQAYPLCFKPKAKICQHRNNFLKNWLHLNDNLLSHPEMFLNWLDTTCNRGASCSTQFKDVVEIVFFFRWTEITGQWQRLHYVREVLGSFPVLVIAACNLYLPVLQSMAVTPSLPVKAFLLHAFTSSARTGFI